MKAIFLGVVASLLLAACAQQPDHYYWGHYEQLLYQMHHSPGEATPEMQVTTLREDIQQAEASGRPVAPGIYAHLGLMYAAQGNVELAIEALNEEKLLYPDATVFIDGMIERASKNSTEG